jgi:uncharacterized protein with beta-barrel porin domain
LVVDGSIANSAVTANVGSVLTGTGTVGATTINAGAIFAPGPQNVAGSMTGAGNLGFQSGALYLVQANATNASHVNVTGAASLAGNVHAAFGSGDNYSRRYTILSTASGLGGSTFSNLTASNLPPGLTAHLGYTTNDVILNLTARLGGPIGAAGMSQNQRNVANTIETYFNNGGALPPTFVPLFGLTGENLGAALTALSGEAATGAQQVGVLMTNKFLSLMLDPFVDGRSGGVGKMGPALAFAPERQPLPDNIARAYASALKAPVKEAAGFEQFPRPWGAAYGVSNRTTGDPIVIGSHDLSARTAGFVGGIDHWLTQDAVMGIALAGGGANWALAQGLGGGRSDAFQAGVYGAARAGPGYLAGALAYTNQWMSTDRLSLAGTHLTANFNALSLGARVEGGYRLGCAFGAFTPYAALQAQRFHTPAHSESDPSPMGFALSYLAHTGTAVRNELGAYFDRTLASAPDAALALRARIAWVHDSVSSPTLTAGFQGLPGASFLVTGAAPLKNSVLVSSGSELRLANGLSLLGKFDGEFADRMQTYAGTATVRLSW